MKWYEMIRYDMTWNGIIWCDMRWPYIILLSVLYFRSHNSLWLSFSLLSPSLLPPLMFSSVLISTSTTLFIFIDILLFPSPHTDDSHWSTKVPNPSLGPIASNNNELLGEVKGADVIIIDDIVGEWRHCLVLWFSILWDWKHEIESVICYLLSYYISYHIISYRIISYLIISYRIISYHVVSYHITWQWITSYYIILYHVVSYYVISYYVMFYFIILHYTTSFQIVVHCITLYNMIQTKLCNFSFIIYMKCIRVESNIR